MPRYNLSHLILYNEGHSANTLYSHSNSPSQTVQMLISLQLSSVLPGLVSQTTILNITDCDQDNRIMHHRQSHILCLLLPMLASQVQKIAIAIRQRLSSTAGEV